MDKSNKLYIKAINSYNDGNLDKSLEYCEKSISENIKNTSAINLKGLLYYLKGELESSQALWKMNYQVNKDLVSKKYLDDTRKDEERLLLFREALAAIKELRVMEAVSILQKCKESDFNSINVNNYLAFCFIRLGEYDKASNHINEVLKVDRTNKTALQSRKDLIGFGVQKKEINYRYVGVVLVLTLLVYFGTLAITSKFNIKSHDTNNSVVNESQKTKSINEIEGLKDENISLGDQSNDKQDDMRNIELFPVTEIKTALNNKDYDKLYDIVAKWENKDLTINDKTLVIKSMEFIARDGVEYFYNKGRQEFLSKDFDGAIVQLSKALKYGEQSYLYPHVIFMLASSYQSNGDIDNSAKYYKEYDNKYAKGDYEETVLYNLALIYDNIDLNMSKVYAKKLATLFAQSIYNNSNIKEILAR